MLEKIKTKLRKADLGDVDRIRQWVTSGDFLMNLYDLDTKDPKKLKNRVIAMVENSTSDPSNEIIMIVETAEKPIGMIMFSHINWRSRNLYESSVIGEEEYKNKVYGLKFMCEVLDFSFNYLKMHKVTGYVYDFNGRMSNLVEHMGAKKEGFLKGFVKRNSKRYGAVVYSFFRRDYPKFLEMLSKY